MPLTLHSKWYERVTKGLCVRGELDTEQRLQHIDPQLFWLWQHFFLIQRGSSNGGLEGPALCWVWFSQLRTVTTDSKLQTHRVISLFDIHLLPVSVTFASNSTRPRSRLYPDIFDRMHLFID